MAQGKQSGILAAASQLKHVLSAQSSSPLQPVHHRITAGGTSRKLTLLMFRSHFPGSDTAATGQLASASISRTRAQHRSPGPVRPGPVKLAI